jgi:hypothetical protein
MELEQVTKKGRLRRVAGLWPEASTFGIWGIGLFGRWLGEGQIKKEMLTEQWYWFVATWLLTRSAKMAASSPRLRKALRDSLEPLVDWLYDLLRRFSDAFYVLVDWRDLLDYLSGRQFDPVVMCAPRGHDRRRPVHRNVANSDTRCETRFCRFGYIRGIPHGISKRKVPGSKQIRLGIWNPLTGKTTPGRLESWSAGEVALRLEPSEERLAPLGNYLAVRMHILSAWRKAVPVRVAEPRRERARRLVVAHSLWEMEDYKDYSTLAPAIPRHDRLGQVIAKSEDWWHKANGDEA